MRQGTSLLRDVTRRQFIVGTGLMVGAYALSACVPVGQPRPAARQHLTIGMGLEARSLDPIRNDTASQYAYKQLYDPLVAMDANLRPIPHVAQEWTIADDGKVYTFKLRPGIRFHDGSELTSQDVRFTFERILDPDMASDKLTYVTMIDGVETPDPETVVIHLKFAYAPFIYSAMQQIVPKAVVERVGDEDFARNPVGSGPFRFTEWRTNEQIEFSRNDDYWLKKPTLEGVVLRIIPDPAVAASNLLAGDVDVIEQVTSASFDQLEAAPDIEIITIPAAQYTYAGFGLMGRERPFSDQRFREAVYHSFDADALVQALFPRPQIATRAYATLPSTASYWPGGDYDGVKGLARGRDLDRARGLFDQLVGEGVMSRDQPIRFLTDQNDARRRSAEAIVAGMTAAGVNVDLMSLEFGSYANLIVNLPNADEGMLYTIFTNPAAPDPDLSLWWLFHSAGGHGRFLGMPEGTDLDERLDRARSSTDDDERRDIYNDVMREAMANVYNIPLFHENIVVAFNRKVDGLQPSPRWDWNLATGFTDVRIVDR